VESTTEKSPTTILDGRTFVAGTSCFDVLRLLFRSSILFHTVVRRRKRHHTVVASPQPPPSLLGGRRRLQRSSTCWAKKKGDGDAAGAIFTVGWGSSQQPAAPAAAPAGQAPDNDE